MDGGLGSGYVSVATRNLKGGGEMRRKLKEVKHDQGGVIQYIDGFAWGIAPDGKTVCCGEEAEVKRAIRNPKLKCNNALVNEIIELERKLTKKED